VTVAIWILAALCVFGFVQALLLFPRIVNRGGTSDGVAERDDPTQREVWVFVSAGDPPLILKPTLDLLQAGDRDGKLLDRALFPGGERHRFYVLQTIGTDRSAITLDLLAEPPERSSSPSASARPGRPSGKPCRPTCECNSRVLTSVKRRSCSTPR
jgi:hypothetical protein